MTIVLVVFLGVLAAAPIWRSWWLRRQPKQLCKPGTALIGYAAAGAFSWFGLVGIYLAVFAPEPAPEGHPLAVKITLAVVAIVALAGIAGSTISWRAEREARKRDAALGLAVGRRWWPSWAVGASASSPSQHWRQSAAQ